MKCRNCFTKEGTGRQSPTTNCSRGKINGLPVMGMNFSEDNFFFFCEVNFFWIIDVIYT